MQGRLQFGIGAVGHPFITRLEGQHAVVTGGLQGIALGLELVEGHEQHSWPAGAGGFSLLQGGDELGRTQSGNNNAYCQDNALTWLDWPQADDELIDFTAGLISLRQRFPQLRRTAWLSGERNANGQRDVVWWHPGGREMNDGDWHTPHRGALGFLLAPECPADNAPTLLVLINRDADAQTFRLPPGTWQLLCDSSSDVPFAELPRLDSSSVAARSVQLLGQ